MNIPRDEQEFRKKRLGYVKVSPNCLRALGGPDSARFREAFGVPEDAELEGESIYLIFSHESFRPSRVMEEIPPVNKDA